MASPAASNNDCAVWSGANFDKLMQDINSLSGDALNNFLAQSAATDLSSASAALSSQSRGSGSNSALPFGLSNLGASDNDSLFMDTFNCPSFDLDAPFPAALSGHATSAAQHRPPPLGLNTGTDDLSSFFHHAAGGSSTAASSPGMPTSPFSATTDGGAGFDFGSILSDLKPNVPTHATSPGASTGHSKVPHHEMGGMMLCPSSSSSSEDEPLFVNAKQYHRIMKRRAARSRCEEMTRLSKERKVSQRTT